jgi:hypothetical protein
MVCSTDAVGLASACQVGGRGEKIKKKANMAAAVLVKASCNWWRHDLGSKSLNQVQKPPHLLGLPLVDELHGTMPR